MKPSTFTISNHIEAIRMFTTFFMYEDPQSESFLQNALPACTAAKYISEHWDMIYDSLSEEEADELVLMIDRAADRMEEFKRDLLNRMEKEMDNEWD